MISVIILVIITGIVYIIRYSSNIVDPMEDIKSAFFNAQIITIFLFISTVLIANLVVKDKKIYHKILLIASIIFMITILVFFMIELKLNTVYTKEKFEQIYLEQNVDKKEKTVTKSKKIALESEKEQYINECEKLYNIFKIKMNTVLIFDSFLNLLIIYKVYKNSRTQTQKNRLSKDDLILFNKEQNVKY